MTVVQQGRGRGRVRVYHNGGYNIHMFGLNYILETNELLLSMSWHSKYYAELMYSTSIKFTYELRCIEMRYKNLQTATDIPFVTVKLKQVIELSQQKKGSRTTTCWHNSRVGTRIKAFGAGFRIRPSEDNFNSSCSSGRR